MSIDMRWIEQHLANRPLSHEERKALGVIDERFYKIGDTIIEQGQPGGVLYMLRSGKASVENNNDGVRVRISDVVEGTLLGEISFLGNHNTTAEVIAGDHCVVYTLTREAFSSIMRDHHDLAFAIFSQMLASQTKIIKEMNSQIIPILRTLKKKAQQLPLIIKVLPVVFVLIYLSALAYVSLGG
ncbi:MAG TPA: cyclic nucleotide-binding domain-containing protein [Gammaproteobacteria bacterium]|nr:cyclic nucleotide-binding domain-containing protein [Gammaproteobacteria bacterium]